MENELATLSHVRFHTFLRDGRPLHVCLTDRLRRAARKEGVWKSRQMLTTLKNAAYGFDEQHARSVSGRDGVFLLDRTFRPVNAMMVKIFDRYIDHPGGGAETLAESFGVPLSELRAVRLVSHHMRLLGVLIRKPNEDWLVLVDCDTSKEGA
ncbi:MAG: hypothetical protein IPK82_00250 [Polyangiaceae bacterium]|nr:hypothetical protein [Polyangiaceae bacterium]